MSHTLCPCRLWHPPCVGSPVIEGEICFHETFVGSNVLYFVHVSVGMQGMGCSARLIRCAD